MRSKLVLLPLGALFVCLTVTTASAQTPPATTPAAAAAPAQAPAAAPEPDPHLEMTLGGAINLVGGEEETRGFTFSNQSIYRIGGHEGKNRFIMDINYQNVKMIHPRDEVITQHFFSGGGFEFDFKQHFTTMVRTEFEHNYQLGLDRGLTERVGAGVHVEQPKVEFVLTANLLANHESLLKADHDESWRLGWGFFQRAVIKPTTRVTNTNRCEFRRDFKNPANEVECQDTLAIYFTKAVGLQIQYNLEYEALLGPGRTKHYEDSTQIGLVFHLGGS